MSSLHVFYLLIIKDKKMKKRFIVFATICVTSASVVFAQQQVKGKVTTENGEPIPFSAISIQNTLLSTASKSDGNYVFKNLKNGKYVLESYFLGYQKQTDTIEINGADIEKNIVLKQSQVVIDEVLVQSTRANNNSGFAFSSMNKEDIPKQYLGHYVTFLVNIHTSIVSAGIYVLNSSVLNLVDKGQSLDMPQLFDTIIKNGQKCGVFLLHEYWMDIGRHNDLVQAQDDFTKQFSGKT
jgi:hypothetical protein